MKIEKRISEYGQTVSTVKIPVGIFDMDSVKIRDGQGKYIGSLSISGDGKVSLISRDGYEFDNYKSTYKYSDVEETRERVKADYATANEIVKIGTDE